MTFKKLFAAVAGVSLLAQTFLPAGVLGATSYGAELEQAYTYAYSVGATTQYPIDNANLYGAITRAELAKVIGAWGEKVLGLKAETSSIPSFSDIASLRSTDLYDAVIKVTQMGLMGQTPDGKFRPYDAVSRAEFGTILSRALWKDANGKAKYDGTTPYYAGHLNALKNAGIMTQIGDAENVKEIRGYVFIMLERTAASYKAEGTDVCKDPLVMLACTVDPESSSCPAACKSGSGSDDKPVNPSDRPDAAGDLEISIADYSTTIKSVPMKGTIIFNSLGLSSSENITLYGINLAKEGLSATKAAKSVWFERNGIRISSKGNVNTDGTVAITFNNGLQIKKSESIDLVVQLDAAAGAEVAFRITDIDSSAKNLNIKNKITSTYRTADYTVAELTFYKRGTNAEYKMGEQSTSLLGEFEVTNVADTGHKDDRAVKVQSLVLKQNGTADLTNLKNIKVYRDSKVVSSDVTVDSKNMTIVLNDVIEHGRKAIYSIEAEVTYVDQATDTYIFALNKQEDLVAVENSSNFRTTTKDGTTTDRTLATYSVKGGKILLTSKSGFATNVDAGKGYTDVVIAEGTLTVTEPIALNKLTLTVTTGGAQLSDTLSRITIEIGGSRYVGDIDNNGVKFDTEFYINKTSTVRLLANISNNATGNAWFQLQAIRGNTFNGGWFQNSDTNMTTANDIAGIITPAKVTVKDSTFNIVKSSNKSQVTMVKNDPASFVFYEGTITNKVASSLTLNTITLSGKVEQQGATSPLAGSDNVYFTLTANGKTVSNTFSSEGKINFNSLGVVLKNGESATIKIEAAPVLSNTGLLAFQIEAEATDVQGNTVKAPASFATNILITEKGDATPSTSNAIKNTLIAEDTTNAIIAQWTMTIKDQILTLKNVHLSGIFDTSAITNWKLEYSKAGTNGEVTATSVTSSQLVANDISERLEPGTYTFTAKVNAAVLGSSTGDLVISGVEVQFDEIALKVLSFSPEYSHRVVKNYPIVTVSRNNSTSSLTDIFTIKVTAGNGSDPIVVTGFELAYSTGANNFDVAISDTNGSLGTGTVSNTATWVQLTTPVTINPGSSHEFRVASSAAQEPGSYLAKLSDIGYTVDNVLYATSKKYNNVAEWASSSFSPSRRINQ